MKRRIVLLGPPASGKGTQAELIQAKYGLVATSTGAMLRDELRRGTDLGKAAAQYTDRGGLVPDALIIELVENWLRGQDGSFVFDGFPRTLSQGKVLDRVLLERGTPLEVVFFFNASFEVIRDRVLNRVNCLQCGHIYRIGLQVQSLSEACPACGGALHRRDDDTEEVLQSRLAEYREKTEPLLPFYRDRGLLVELSAAATPEEVFSGISSVLEAA